MTPRRFWAESQGGGCGNRRPALHCLARVGEMEQAFELAEDAVNAAPRNRDHRALLEWIEKGAPTDDGPRVSQKKRDGASFSSHWPRNRRRFSARFRTMIR